MSHRKSSQAHYGYEGPGRDKYIGQRSAEIVVPIIIECFKPRNVVDVGCGIGLWTKEFLGYNIDTWGMDGDWIDELNLLIPKDRFITTNLLSDFRSSQKYDLCICLEVAEHLPSANEDNLIAGLTSLSDIVVFSAAIPGQGGYKHINEKFQHEWIAMFEAVGYGFADVLRPRIWMKEDVRFYYQQNMLVFISNKEKLSDLMENNNLSKELQYTSIVHPELYNRRRDPRQYSLIAIINNIPFYLKLRMAAFLSKAHNWVNRRH